MRKINKDILITLEKVAAANPSDNAKVAAAVVRNNRIVSIGINANKSHPMAAKFGKNEQAIFLHAEIAAIKNALKEVDVDDLEKMEMYVVRVKKPKPFSKKWVWGLAKPCVGCQRAIAEFGLRRVVYTTDEHGTYEVM
jgi:tRNA(Arg) A34 adenosine deaminase TadA